MAKTTKPDFTEAAETPEFRSALADLEKLCGGRSRPLKEVKGGFVVSLSPGKAKSFKLDRTHADFLKRGCLVFDPDAECEQKRIAVLPTADKYEAMFAVGTNGINWDLETKDIVARLRRLEREQPFIATGISCEHVSGKFTTKIKQPEELAFRILALAPDSGDPDETEKKLRQSAGFWLWWT